MGLAQNGRFLFLGRGGFCWDNDEQTKEQNETGISLLQEELEQLEKLDKASASCKE